MQNELSSVLTGMNLDEEAGLTLSEISCACAASDEWIIALVDESVLVPIGNDPANWHFSGANLRRARIGLRLQRELDINLAGVALALDLLEEIETLRARLRVLSRDA